MSGFIKNNPDLAALAAMNGIRNIQDNAARKIVETLERLHASQEETPWVRRYKIMAANGYELNAQCTSCNGQFKFLPEYGGQYIDCIHCGEFMGLCRAEDLLSRDCCVCRKPVRYMEEPGPELCRGCTQSHHVGTCPYCQKRIAVLQKDMPAASCPNPQCLRKIKAYWKKFSQFSSSLTFEKPGLFGW